MKKIILIILFIITLPVISYAGEYSTNYNVVLNDENDTAIMRIICIGLGSRPPEVDTNKKDYLDKDCVFFQLAFENLSDKPITVEKRIMGMAFFNYEGEFRLNEDGKFLKNMDVLRNIPVNWEKIILPDNETQYIDFPLCGPEKSEKYNLMMLELHLSWNEKKYFISLNMPFKIEKTAEQQKMLQ